MSKTKPPNRIDWSAVPWCFVPAPTCQSCGSPRYRRQRTDANGDGSITRLAICLDCRQAYKIVTEFPPWGNYDSAKGTIVA